MYVIQSHLFVAGANNWFGANRSSGYWFELMLSEKEKSGAMLFKTRDFFLMWH
jgi:hypothetical protein